MWVEANVKTAAASTTSGAASPAEEVRSSEPCLRKRPYQNALPNDHAEMWMQRESMERASGLVAPPSNPRTGNVPFEHQCLTPSVREPHTFLILFG
jgi:hypothetical protein